MVLACQIKMTEIPNRVKKLEDIEQVITAALGNAGNALMELSKEKPNEKNLEKFTENFITALEAVESDLSKQIVDLEQIATNQQHEGSIYSAQKDVNLFKSAIYDISMKVDDMIKTCENP